MQWISLIFFLLWTCANNRLMVKLATWAYALFL